jgi:hypothetical protein
VSRRARVRRRLLCEPGVDGAAVGLGKSVPVHFKHPEGGGGGGCTVKAYVVRVAALPDWAAEL